MLRSGYPFILTLKETFLLVLGILDEIYLKTFIL